MAGQLYFTLLLLLALNCINCLNKEENVAHYVSTEKIEAENYSSATYYQILNSCNDESTLYMWTSSSQPVWEYDAVDFGSGVNALTLRVSSTYQGAPLHVDFSVGSSTAAAFASIPVPYIGTDPCYFQILAVELNAPLVGQQNVFVTFRTTGSYNDIALDWFVFNHTAPQFVATEVIEVEDYSWAQSVDIYEDCVNSSVIFVGDISTGTILDYYQVDFGSDGVEMVTLRVSNYYLGNSTATINLRLDSSSAKPFANITVGQTGTDRCDFFTTSVFLNSRPSGVHYLFITFSSLSDYLSLDWLTFT